MSRLLGKELTQALFDRLAAEDASVYEGKIIPIFTPGDDGWPHPALLSYYEVVAKERSLLEMALWKESSTAANLRRAGKVTIMITDRGVNCYLKGNVTELEREMSGAPQVSRFRVTIESLLEDQEPNAEITSGMTYTRRTARQSNDFSVKVWRLLRAAR